MKVATRFLVISILLSPLALAEPNDEPRAIVDFFYPKTIGFDLEVADVVDADDSRRFYEGWSKRVYLIKDTAVIEGDAALKLFAAIKKNTSKEDVKGWSGHDPSVAVTILYGTKKAFIGTFSFKSGTWARRENGKYVRAGLVNARLLEESLMLFDPSNARSGRSQ